MEIFLFVICIGIVCSAVDATCNEFNPPGEINVNFDDLEGVWHVIKMKTLSEDFKRISATIEWIKGTNKGISSYRPILYPNMCMYTILKFTSNPDTEEGQFVMDLGYESVMWKLLYVGDNYILTWGCFERVDENCIGWKSLLLRKNKSHVLPDDDMQMLEAISFEATCKTISIDYTDIEDGDDCPRLGLPKEEVCSSEDGK